SSAKTSALRQRAARFRRKNSSRQFKAGQGIQVSKVISRARLVSWVAFFAAFLSFNLRHAFGFALEGPKWPFGTIPMVIQVGAPNFVLPDGFLDWNADAENALAQWNEQMGGVQFTWTEAGPSTAGS